MAFKEVIEILLALGHPLKSLDLLFLFLHNGMPSRILVDLREHVYFIAKSAVFECVHDCSMLGMLLFLILSTAVLMQDILLVHGTEVVVVGLRIILCLSWIR
jgi:hypothetical protein